VTRPLFAPVPPEADFVALEEAGHEELFRERRELHAAGLPVVHDLVLIVDVDELWQDLEQALARA